MPKNQVQFQKGLSLRDFLDQFGTAEQCERALFRIRWPEGLCRDACGSPGLPPLCPAALRPAPSLRPIQKSFEVRERYR